MNLVSLLILPAVITMRNHTGGRLGIAGGALVVLLVSIAFSKRKTEGFGETAEIVEGDTPVAAGVAP